MRSWPWLPVAGALVVGLGLGIALERARSRAAFGPLDSRPVGLSATPPGELGARPMARVGRGFVAAVPDHGVVTFYDQPKPFGTSLCRMNVYRVPKKVVAGRLERPQERWEDDVAVSNRSTSRSSRRTEALKILGGPPQAAPPANGFGRASARLRPGDASLAPISTGGTGIEGPGVRNRERNIPDARRV